MSIPKAEFQRRMNAFADGCSAQGLKRTHQRLEIFRELAGSEEHPDAETIYQRIRKRLPTISRDTVYRTLAMLEEAGLIRKAGPLSGATRYDANTDQHHHFICTQCGKVSDFYSEAFDQLPIPRSVKAMGRIQWAQVQVKGICRACAEGKVKRSE